MVDISVSHPDSQFRHTPFRHMSYWSQTWPCDLLWLIKYEQKWHVSSLSRSTQRQFVILVILPCSRPLPGQTLRLHLWRLLQDGRDWTGLDLWVWETANISPVSPLPQTHKPSPCTLNAPDSASGPSQTDLSSNLSICGQETEMTSKEEQLRPLSNQN